MRLPNATISPGWRWLLAVMYDLAPDQFYVVRANGFIIGEGRHVWHTAN